MHLENGINLITFSRRTTWTNKEIMKTSIDRPFALICFFYGFNIFLTEGKYLKILRLVIKSLNIIIMVFMMCYTLQFAILSEKSLYKYSFHMKSWIVLITFLKLNYEFKNVEQLLLTINEQLSPNECKRTRIWNILCTVIWLIFVPSNACVFVWLSSQEAKTIVRESIWAFYGFGWITTSVLILTYMCCAINLIERKNLRQINILSENVDNETEVQELNYEEILQKLFSIQKLKQSIDDNLGLLPLLWFFELFSSTCFRLTQISSEDNNNAKDIRLILEYFYEYFQLSIVYFVYIICLNYFQTRRPTKTDLMIWFNTYTLPIKYDEKCSQKYILLQYLMDCYSKTTYMAWNLFPIDIKFIFGFIGSVVTFAVMFIQLNQK